MRVNVVRYVTVAMIAAMAMVIAVLPALAEADYPPDEPSDSVTTMEEPTEDQTASSENEDVAFTGTSLVVPLAIGVTAVAAGAALVLTRRRDQSDGPGAVG